MIETHFERRIAGLEKQLAEACTIAQGLRLALEEAQRQITELTRLREESRKQDARGKKSNG
jgi:hypothetical protein